MSRDCSPAGRVTKSLLGYGIIAGPLYVVVGLAQALTRDGFDISKHAWSLLTNGDLGWIQIANFIVTGLMTVVAAVGLRRALVPGRGRVWAALLIAIYGVSVMGAGVFRPDPAQGFPAGAPETPAITGQGVMHFVVGGVGFPCLIAACFVLASRFSRDGLKGLAWFSRVTGVVFLAGFMGIASGSHGPTTLGFVAAILVVYAWLTTISIHFYRVVD